MASLSRSLISLIGLLGATTLVSALAIEPRQAESNIIPRTVSPNFPSCKYPKGWVGCNTPQNRRCWVKDDKGKEYNIGTDYDKEWPLSGEVREYSLTIGEAVINADGTPKNIAQVLNGTYPGPLIEACWGDTVIVHVKSELPTNGTALHFHGVRQLNTNHMDGTSGVTQCPIAQGDSFTYKFTATQYGHSWYHSHYSAQYSDGAAGPFLVHGPSSENWDYESAPIVVSDWFHDRAYKLMEAHLKNPGTMPAADSILFNGVGKFNGKGTHWNFPQKFESGKRYLIRIINASTGLHFHFEIDKHDLTLVAADFVAIEPVKVEKVSVGIGQRYTMVVEAKPKTVNPSGKYWMRTSFGSCSGQIAVKTGWTPGIVSYTDANNDEPSKVSERYGLNCDDEPISRLNPIVKWNVNNNPQNDVKQNTYEGGFENKKFHGANRWSLTDTPLWLDWSNPLLFNLGNSSFNPEYGVVSYNYNKEDQLVYLVINSGNTNPATHTPIKAASPAHPIHLHGHDFAIVATGRTYNPTSTTFVTANATRRDTAMLPGGGGFIAIAWRPDNPGAWLLHCHIAWHAGSGMALNILERKDDIKIDLGQAEEGCKNWKTWLKAPGHADKFVPERDQEDGI